MMIKTTTLSEAFFLQHDLVRLKPSGYLKSAACWKLILISIKKVKFDYVEEEHVVAMSSKALRVLDGSSHSTTDSPAILKIISFTSYLSLFPTKWG